MLIKKFCEIFEKNRKASSHSATALVRPSFTSVCSSRVSLLLSITLLQSHYSDLFSVLLCRLHQDNI